MNKYTIPSDAAFATFGKQVAALLGTQAEWDGGDCLEDIAHMADNQLGVPVDVGNEELFAFWRVVADQMGVYYDPGVLPTEPGFYADLEGYPWRLFEKTDSYGQRWHYGPYYMTDNEAREHAPFTRLEVKA